MGEIYQSLILEGNMYSIRVNAFIDTGANANYMKESLAKSLFDKNYLEFQKKNHTGKVHFTDKDWIYGYSVLCEIKVRNVKKTIKFIVIDRDFGDGIDIVIGVPFLQQNQVDVSFVDDKMRFRKMTNRKGNWL